MAPAGQDSRARHAADVEPAPAVGAAAPAASGGGGERAGPSGRRVAALAVPRLRPDPLFASQGAPAALSRQRDARRVPLLPGVRQDGGGGVRRRVQLPRPLRPRSALPGWR